MYSDRAIFLDRDGVLNQAIVKNGKPYPPASLSELHIPPEVPPTLLELKSKGFMLIGATNQPDVARGTTSRFLVETINAEVRKQCHLDEIRVCYHDDHQKCLCRKPAPGLLVEAAYDYALDLTQCIMIGDRWKDIEAGQQAGCKTIWINLNYSEKHPDNPPDFIAFNFKEAATWIIKNF